MSAIKQEPRFQQTPSPPSNVLNSSKCHSPHGTSTNSESSFWSYPNCKTPQNVTSGKPEITFSIERILGLNSHRSINEKSDNYNTGNFLQNSHHHHHQQETTTKDEELISGRYDTSVFHRGYSHRSPIGTHFTMDRYGDVDGGDEDVDDDVGDDIDDEDDEYIDVDADETEACGNVPCPDGDATMVSGYSKFDLNEATTKYQWLQCTRYHPPKIQRSKKAVTKKRKLGRNPRVPFTPHQVSVLEEKFRRTHYLSSMDVVELSTALNLTETRVKIWFQNRRARERRDKEASQRNQNTPVVNNNNNNTNNGGNPNNTTNNKNINFQPLTIPSVAWPISSPVAAGNYPRFDSSLNFRPGYLSSAFRLYSPSAFAAAAAVAAGSGGVRFDSIESKQIQE